MQMKPIIWLGVLLVVLGALALAYQGFNYTRQEKILDVGPIHATTERHERVSIPPLLGGLALVGGVALLAVGAKRGA
jgi:drug/metabolite transporter (DMT)-like permease